MEAGIDDNVSVTSQRSGASSASAVDAAARARARAEAAWAHAAFAEKEVQLKLEKAEKEAKLQLEKAKLDAELGTLTLQREHPNPCSSRGSRGSSRVGEWSTQRQCKQTADGKGNY